VAAAGLVLAAASAVTLALTASVAGLAVAGAVAAIGLAVVLKMWLFPSTRRLVSGDFRAFAPVWSPSGKHLAFLIGDDSSTSIAVYDSLGAPHQIDVYFAKTAAGAWDYHALTDGGGLTGGTATVGVRMPGHAVARALVRAARRPLTAPSANPSAAPPPCTAEAVREYFDGRVELILDGGPTAGGAGSTVADCTVWPPRILRQGPVVLEASCG